MTIDFSALLKLLENIDFTNPENLIFFAILLAVVVVVLFIIGWVFAGIVRMVRRIIIRLFDIEVRKPRFNKKEGTEWLHQQEVPQEAERPKKAVSAPEQKIVPVDFVRSSGEKQEPERKPEQEYKEKEEKAIEEGLEKLKTAKGGEIKIPTPMHPSGEPKSFAASQDRTNVVGASNISIPQPKESGVADASMFGGKPEVSRIKLEHELRKDTKVWQAARQEGLTLSPTERAKLVKEVFSPTLGRNISKTDLKLSIKKLNQKMLGAKSPTEHAKLRKEIKFFKKIGGIK